MKNVTITNGVKAIGQWAFACCTSLESIEIPNSVTNIGDLPFDSCTNLEKVTIYSKDVSFSYDVFYNCPNLTLYGYTGSTAETYANKNDIPFVALDEDFLVGDLNLDETVDVDDAILLLQYSLYPKLYPIEYSDSLDFNKDGIVDVRDAILLLQNSMFPDLYPIE